MTNLKGIFSNLHGKLSHGKHELSETLTNHNNQDHRGGAEKDVARAIDQEEWSSGEDDIDDPLQHRQVAKSLDDFLDNNDPPDAKDRYGVLPLMQSQDQNVDGDMWSTRWTSLANVDSSSVGKEICFRARVHIVRHMSAKLAFVIFREQTTLIQGVLSAHDGGVSENMVR
jgi:aspartyl-tRNA synthetase